jgi:hypothetical protein
MTMLRSILNLWRKPRKLNCWPGAVAVVVSDGVIGQFLGGRTVTCTTLTKNAVGEPAWCYEGTQFLLLVGVDMVLVEFIPDAALRPITPPDGTVSQEEVRELFSPKSAEKTKERV